MRERRRYAAAVFLAALLAALVGAADPPVRVPGPPLVPLPMPPGPRPDAPVRLAGSALFVIDGDVQFFVFASPAGAVRVVEDTGPMKIRGTFADGTGLTETRTYKGKYVTTIEGVASGRCELLVVPAGLTKPGDVIRRTLDVDAGPPDPTPQPNPKPPQPSPQPAAPIPEPGFRVLVVYETADLPRLPPAQNAVLFSAKVREYLNGKCAAGPDGKTPEYRFLDKDADAAKDSKLWADAMIRTSAQTKAWKPLIGPDGKTVGPSAALPWIVVSTGTTGFEGPLPADVDATLALLKKYGG